MSMLHGKQIAGAGDIATASAIVAIAAASRAVSAERLIKSLNVTTR
jgi:hypothetical protein